MFLWAMHITDVTLAAFSEAGANWLMALYAFQLLSGSNLMCRTITSGTAGRYCHDVSRFILHFRSDDRRKQHGSDNLCPQLENVLDSAKRWENIKNKREPLTTAMILARDVSHMDEDSLPAAIHDWSVAGLHAGFPGGEWCQMTKAEYAILGKFLPTVFPRPFDGRQPRILPRAFCLCDVPLRNSNGAYIRINPATFDDNCLNVYKVGTRYKEQKNGEHGEIKWCIRNDACPEFCPVRAWIRFIKRFLRCYPHALCDQPLAVHKKDDCFYNIIEKEVNGELKTMASLAYNLDPSKSDNAKALSKWTTHSVRVGACVVLHAKGCSPANIKRLLRWKSDTYLQYLRDLHFLAERQNLAEYPHLFQ